MSGKVVKPWVKSTLELGPILAFFAGYILLRDREFNVAGAQYSGFIVMTALFIPLIAVSTFALWRLTGKLSAMQIMTLVLVTVFGGLTIWLNDERFFKMKPTIIYLLFAAILGWGLSRNQSYLSLVMGEFMPLDKAGWIKLTWRMTLLFLAMALANELVWRMMSTDAWVRFKTFGLPVIMFGFFMSQTRLFADHGIEQDETGAQDGSGPRG